MNYHLDHWNPKKAIVELLLDILALQHSAPVLNHFASALSYCSAAYTSRPWLYAALLCPSATKLSPRSKLSCPGLHFPSVALRCTTLPQCYTT
ncbi:hypothetical protein DAPPUDRAFT_262303 [Daphnia pulex]|uniref:Uncharacterized protein n=1 Tax=Daphnia pulex TaxID=6669 RepID=E9HMS7_DAPPU|nr:hypothetical protein DAPPUDRAFT_262303 [Daphnia pulex]|eukprot:EFX66958.1 hypothetical protein DAPPUDRAFT_262303 [Daphnia pulex]